MKIRAHHGMCLAFFIGEGYSSDFVDNMWDKKRLLEKENPIIEIVGWADSICEKCPHNKSGICTSIEKVEQYDSKVLDFCEVQKNSIMKWNDFSDLVKSKIIDTGIRKSICADCSWNSICTEIENKLE